MYLVFDIGGTKTRIATSKDASTIDKVVKFETPPIFDDGINKFVQEAETLLAGETVTAIAGGIRGPLNHEKSMILSETVLLDWVGKPLKDTLMERFNATVSIENDTALVGLGEAVVGAGKGYSIVAYHTVSTGVGGVRLVDGHIDIASAGFEPGKQVIDIDHTVIPSAKSGSLEDLISGEALQLRVGKKPYEVPQSDAVWEELAQYLAYGLKNTIVYWSPDVIVLGGSMIVGDPRILLAPIQEKTAALLDGLMPCPPIVDAVLKDEGGLYGSLALLRQKQT